MSGMVIDASALLAYVLGETGGESVSDALMTGCSLLSAVNYAEVIAVLSDYGVSSEQLARDFAEKNIIDLVEITDFTPDLAEVAAELRQVTRSLGLSLGDRACLALAKTRNLPALTADRKWSEVPDVVVKVIR